MRRIARIASSLAALFFLCIGILRAEVYTIDFNRGTVCGVNSISTPVNGVDPSYFCSVGADLFTLHSSTIRSYYDDNGCGIRIAAPNGKGMFILSLAEKKHIVKVVVYASKIDENSALEFHTADGLMKNFDNTEMTGYSANAPASTSYRLPDIFINGEYKDLKFQAGKGNCVVLHRVDIYVVSNGDDDAVTAPTASFDEMGVFCNLSGQRITKPSRGIYIKDGKKYVAK